MGISMAKKLQLDKEHKSMNMDELVKDLKRSVKVLSSDDLKKKRNTQYSYFI